MFNDAHRSIEVFFELPWPLLARALMTRDRTQSQRKFLLRITKTSDSTFKSFIGNIGFVI